MHEEKVKKYAQGKLAVTPFILSAGGVAGPSAMDVIDTLTRMFNPNDETEQLWFRSKLLGAMSCTLIRSANFHYHRHARRSVPASQ